MTNLEQCKTVLADLEKASGPNIVLEAKIWCATNGYHYVAWDGAGCAYREDDVGNIQHAPLALIRPYLSSLDATIALVERVLPGWWWIAGLCGLTGHASIGPDYNGPHRERLLREFPIEKFDAGFDVDLAPGDGIHRACYALLTAMFRALVAKMEGVE